MTISRIIPAGGMYWFVGALTVAYSKSNGIELVTFCTIYKSISKKSELLTLNVACGADWKGGIYWLLRWLTSAHATAINVATIKNFYGKWMQWVFRYIKCLHSLNHCINGKPHKSKKCLPFWTFFFNSFLCQRRWLNDFDGDFFASFIQNHFSFWMYQMKDANAFFNTIWLVHPFIRITLRLVSLTFLSFASN